MLINFVDRLPHILWSVQPDGCLVDCNQHWREYTGLTWAQTQDQGWTQAIHPEDWAGYQAVWEQAQSSGKLSEATYRLRRGDGTYRWHLVRLVPQYDPTGLLCGWLGTSTDIQDLPRPAVTELERTVAQLRGIVSSMTEGLIVSDPLGNVLSMNPRALELHEYSLEAAQTHLHHYPKTFELHDLAGQIVPLAQ
ncbi:PAS domain-containing protein [Candidatus Cyanaurora vandensis]|uniref:PAS domain-containing protein n=1 Tax=Candidatus Cyanaurora vandensis TaxID=2714958 RepID=UPI00257DA21B|nr:PAS domain-containing protein [Candidatus Cyanaurora vandensis]